MVTTTDDEGRGRTRHRRSLAAGSAAVVARGAQVVSTLIAVRLALPALGAERYGLWATLTGLVAMLSFADLGLGNGLVTTLPQVMAVNDKPAGQRLVASAFFALVGVSAVMTLLGGLAWWLVPWAAALNLKDPLAQSEASLAVLALGLTFVVSLPLTLAQKVHLGFQEGYLGALFQGLGSGLSVIGVVLVAQVHATVPALVLAVIGGPLISSGLNSLWLFGLHQPWLRPQWSNVSRDALRTLWRLGVLFFILQVAIAIAFLSDNLVIGRVLSPSEIGPYMVHAQPLTWVTGFANVFLMPLWPAWSDALTRRDFQWLRASVRRALMATVLATVGLSLGFIFFGPTLLQWWLGSAVSFDRSLAMSMSLLTVAMALGSALSILLNAGGVVRFQVVTAILTAVAALSAKAVGATYFGTHGVVWGTLGAYVLFTLLPTATYVRSWLTRVESREEPAADSA